MASDGANDDLLPKAFRINPFFKVDSKPRVFVSLLGWTVEYKIIPLYGWDCQRISLLIHVGVAQGAPEGPTTKVKG